MFTEKEVQTLQNRVSELEKQLEEARVAIRTLKEHTGIEASLQDRELAKTRLLELEQARLTAVLENLPLGVWIADEKGTLIGKNRQADRIWAGEAPILKSIEEYQEYIAWYPDSGKHLQPEDYPVAIALRTGQHVEPVELTIRRFDGSTGTVLVSAAPIKDSQGQLLGVVGVNVDITERKRAEERFHKAFHASPSALVISRQEDGLIETVNETFVKFFGYTKQEVIGKTSTELGMFVNPADRQEAIRKLQEDKSVRDFELDVRLKSGEVRSVSLSVELMNIGGQNAMLTMIQNITERKQFEIALRKRESILAQAGEIAHLGAWDIEFHNQDNVNANPLNWSDEVYRIFGYAPDEVQPSNEFFFERVHPEDRALVQESVAQAIATGQPYKIEHRIRRPDGEERIVQEHAEIFFDESGKLLRMVGAVQDITEPRRAEEASRKSEQRFRSLADSMPQLVWTARPDGTVDYYNQRYHEYWGIKRIAGGHWEWAPVLQLDDLQPTVDAWQHSVETGEIYQIEHRVRMADGSYRWHLSRGVPMLDEKGQIVRWFGTATDIHDTKLAEEQLKVYTERLERSNRELEQFAFMASHDLQEPLRKIEVFGDLLLESSKSLSGRERNYLDRMRDAAGRMRDMVDGLLQLSRVTTQGKPFVQVSLSQVIEDVLYDLENQIRRTGGKVEVGNVPAIDGDPLQLRQLMQNLIGNALKYHQPDIPPEVRIHTKQLEGKVQIFVEDNGIGFEQADAERIFKPFQRLVGRSQYEGSGMGLAICRRIVERHGGEITARSQPRQGSTFVVTLPMYQTKVARKDIRNEESGTAPDRRR